MKEKLDEQKEKFVQLLALMLTLIILLTFVSGFTVAALIRIQYEQDNSAVKTSLRN
jgi:uncharacterized membrane protein YqjE